MHTAPVFPEGWRFDWRSAMIGAFLAWLLAFILYRQRASLRQFGEQLWAPIARWRTQLQRSTEEKYLLALRRRLRAQWLFEPETPEAIFVPPTLLAAPPLPETLTETFDAEARLQVPYAQLLDGHPRVLLTGARGTGRTTALAAGVWHLIAPPQEDAEHIFTHFPLWIDLSLLPEEPPATDENEDENAALTWLTELAVQFFPQARPNWLAEQLQRQPALVLVDNWEAVAPERRGWVAQQLKAAAEQLPEAMWLIATNTTGYGPLVEADFVPVDLEPSVDPPALHALYEGWASELEHAVLPLEESVERVFKRALESGDDLVDLTLRIWAYGKTGQAPYRLHDALEICKEQLLPPPELDDTKTEEAQETARDAHALAVTLLQELAWQQHTEQHAFSLQELKEVLLAELLPPEEARPPDLEKTALDLIRDTGFLDWQRKVATFRHPLWQQFWLAHKLVADQNLNLLREHLQDPNWAFIVECTLGMAPTKALVATLLKKGLPQDELGTLLKVTRWVMLAPDDVAWRKFVIKALAQALVKPKFTLDERLKLGQALALTAEETARPFFLQILRHPEATVRATAFRGLGWTGRPRDVEVLASGLDDPVFEVQKSAVHGLSNLGTPGAYRILKDGLAEVDERLMLVIAETLAEDPQGWEALKESVHAEDLLVRRAAVHGLGKIAAPWATEILEQMVREDPQWLVRSAAEAALENQKPTVVKRATIPPPPKLDEAAWLITWAAQQGLGVGVGDAALRVLLSTLEAEDPQARLLGCATLARVGRLEHLAPLASLLEDEKDPKVRKAAVTAQRQIEGRYQGIADDV
ncbi:MAG: HEAT repeat domain-containing protein [Anaerolineae bacterium]